MTLWFVFALMTAAAVFAVLLPLGLTGRPRRGGDETTVYKDQLAEVERDVAVGLIGPAEAEAAAEAPGRLAVCAASRWRASPLREQADGRDLRSPGG